MKIQERRKICRDICSVLRKKKTFFLSGHVKPDGDTVASEDGAAPAPGGAGQGARSGGRGELDPL